MRRITVVLVALCSVARADTVTLGGTVGAALGGATGGEGPGLFVNAAGAADWHSDPSTAFGIQARAWTINTRWQDVLARVTLSTVTSDNVRMFVRGGVGAARLHRFLDDSRSAMTIGLAYQLGCGLLIATSPSSDITIEVGYNHFSGSQQTDSVGYTETPEISVVALSLGFDTTVW